MIEFFKRFTVVETTDTVDQRRSRLLNLLLLGVGGLCVLALIPLITSTLMNIWFDQGEGAPLISGTLLLIAAIGICLWLNRIGKVTLASSIFLGMITLVFAFADSPIEVVRGRTLFMFVIPVMMASFLLRPFASFIVAAFVSILHMILAFSAAVPEYSPVGLIAFLVIALVAWLAARNLEVALDNLHQVNRDLDQRVNERTQELADANQQLLQQAQELASANSLLEQQTSDLESANERLKSLDQLKSKFVSDVSHELRTPISNLMIYLEMMEAGDPEKNERYLNVLRHETSRLQKLVKDVLNLTRMEIGAVKIEFTYVDLNEVAQQVVTANQIRAEAKQLDLQFTPGEDLPLLWADADQINQVINNLVGNAINYTDKGCISVSSWLDAENQRLGMRVKDTGSGISDTDIPHLFERFYRGQQASQSTIAGTGLGLSITKEILSHHKGTIEVKSQLGVGSEFTIYLPLIKASDQEGRPQGAHS